MQRQRRNWAGALFLLVAVLAAAVYIGPVLAQFPSGGGGNSQDGVTCFFSPEGGCTEAVIAELQRAQRSVLVQAYSFTSAPIAKALVEAHDRGVMITVILDKSDRTEQYSAADFVQHAGIATYIDDKHAIAHNKIMLIDGRTIITGSFNFTKQAETSTPKTYWSFATNKRSTRPTKTTSAAISSTPSSTKDTRPPNPPAAHDGANAKMARCHRTSRRRLPSAACVVKVL